MAGNEAGTTAIGVKHVDDEEAALEAGMAPGPEDIEAKAAELNAKGKAEHYVRKEKVPITEG